MEFINSFKAELLAIFPEILRIFITDAIALATVYLLGRMLELVKSIRSKNFLAFIMIVGVSTFYSCYFYDFDNKIALAFDAATYAAFSIIVYVLVAFKLYDRIDALLDRKIGIDKPLKRPPTIKSKKTK